jgi:general secretion pathway protein C
MDEETRMATTQVNKSKGGHDNRRMQARLTAFFLWAAVAALVVFWALRLGARAPAVPAQAVAVSTAAGARGDLGRLLGQRPAQADAEPVASPDAGRFQLVGVVAPRGGGSSEGLAVIAVDGKPARTYRVGTVVDERYVLQSVRTRGADLGPRGGHAQLQLELPPLPTANTGTLPLAGSEAPAAAGPGGRAPQGGGGPQRFAPGQGPQGLMRQPVMPQQIPQQEMAPQEMPVPQQELEQQPMPEPEPGQGQGG